MLACGRVWQKIPASENQKGRHAGVAMAWGLETDEEALKVMQSITETGSGLRILTQTLRLAAMVAKRFGQAD